MEWLADPKVWIAFLTLVALELVLGVDNVIFITILAGPWELYIEKPERHFICKARGPGSSD